MSTRPPRMPKLIRRMALAVIAAVLVPTWTAPADAAKRPKAPPGGQQVTGCSHFGHGCVTAPIRTAQFGQEVRLPGGTWIGCAQDCKTKLTDETVDFWDRKRFENAERPR